LGVENETVADVLQDLVHLSKEGRFDIVFKHLLRLFPVAVKPALVDTNGFILLLTLCALSFFGDEGILVKETFKEAVFSLIRSFQCLLQRKFHIVFIGSGTLGGVKPPAGTVSQNPPVELTFF